MTLYLLFVCVFIGYFCIVLCSKLKIDIKCPPSGALSLKKIMISSCVNLTGLLMRDNPHEPAHCPVMSMYFENL